MKTSRFNLEESPHYPRGLEGVCNSLFASTHALY